MVLRGLVTTPEHKRLLMYVGKFPFLHSHKGMITIDPLQHFFSVAVLRAVLTFAHFAAVPVGSQYNLRYHTSLVLTGVEDILGYRRGFSTDMKACMLLL